MKDINNLTKEKRLGYIIYSLFFIVGYRMCDGQQAILDLIKAGEKLPPEMIAIHQKQIEDFDKMNAKIVKIEKDLEELKTNSKVTDEKVDKILNLLTSNKSLNPLFSKLLDVKYFWLWLIIITGLIFGVNFESIIDHFSK